MASLEHSIPFEAGVEKAEAGGLGIPFEAGVEKAVAGGLGKVAGLLGRYHPGAFISVHACMPNRKYAFAEEEEPVDIVIRKKTVTVNVYRYRVESAVLEDAPSVTYLLLDHPIFRSRTEIYPTPQTSKATLEFYALWNQAVARIIDRVNPDVFHCPDFHAAMAVLYLERPLPVVVFLHNAEYQGAVSTQHMGRSEARQFAEIFNLPADIVQKATFEDGKFSMLKPVIDYVRVHQQGFGVCAVSRNYAAEVSQKHAVFWGLPEVRGIENCMPETERMDMPRSSPEEYASRRAEAKRCIQEKYELELNPNARIFVFVGRWVKQKGIDFIADIAEWMLTTFSDAQLLMIGPVGDPHGAYAKKKMEMLMSSGRVSKNLFVHTAFLAIPLEVKLACDFCLMPSRDEPFGYVDIEFAWFGAVVVGSLRGGLGKLPGFYFQILNSDSSSHMQRQFQKAVAKAMSCDSEMLSRMSMISRRSSFPVIGWQQEVLQVYDKVMRSFDWDEQKLPRPKPADPLTVQSGALASQPSIMSARSQQLYSHRSTESARSSAEISVIDVEMESGGSQVSHVHSADEFLRQEASEVKMQVLVEAKFSGGRAPRSAAAVLEEVEWEMQLSLEKHRMSKLLGKRVFDVPLIDWIIAWAYLTGPLVTALPVAEFSGSSSVAFYIVDPLVQSVSLIFWTMLSCKTPPNLLMVAACMTRLVLLGLPLLSVDPTLCALTVGLLAPADYVFIYYSFMGHSVGDIARLAVRTGMMLAVREYWAWLFLGFHWHSDLQRNAAVACSALFFSVLPALALLRAPKLYWEFRVPTLQFAWVHKLHVLVLLGLAGIVQSLSHVSESALLILRQTHPYELTNRQTYCIALGSAGLIPLVAFAVTLRMLPSYAMSLVKGIACFGVPGVLLRCWAQYEINQAVELTFNLDVLIFVSSMLGSLSVYAVAVAVLATVGSRWRFVSYTCCTGVFSNLARVASFLIVQWHTGKEDPLRAMFLPQTLAWDLFVVALPPCAMAVVLRIIAFVFFDKEATGMLQTSHQRRILRLSRSASSYGKLPDLPDSVSSHTDSSSGGNARSNIAGPPPSGAGHHIVDVVPEDEELDTERSRASSGWTSSLPESASDYNRQHMRRSVI